MCRKCCVRRPTPSPRSGRFQRFGSVSHGSHGIARHPGPATRMAARLASPERALKVCLDRHFATALALAGVLAGAAGVAALAAALALALVLALAAVLRIGGATTLALAGVLAGAAAVAAPCSRPCPCTRYGLYRCACRRRLLRRRTRHWRVGRRRAVRPSRPASPCRNPCDSWTCQFPRCGDKQLIDPKGRIRRPDRHREYYGADLKTNPGCRYFATQQGGAAGKQCRHLPPALGTIAPTA